MKYIIGIDEVGRGALAGPVVVAAVAIPKGFAVRNRELGKLRDSKKLSALQRDGWARYFTIHPKISYAVARVYPKTIDRINISAAANLAALRSFSRLTVAGGRCQIFLDGGLFLGSKKKQQKNAKTVVKGDENITAIKIASILAKVYRDGLMRRLAKKHPKYGFEIHKGYGTKAHMRAVKRHGSCEAHRLTFVS